MLIFIKGTTIQKPLRFLWLPIQKTILPSNSLTHWFARFATVPFPSVFFFFFLWMHIDRAGQGWWLQIQSSQFSRDDISNSTKTPEGRMLKRKPQVSRPQSHFPRPCCSFAQVHYLLLDSRIPASTKWEKSSDNPCLTIYLTLAAREPLKICQQPACRHVLCRCRHSCIYERVTSSDCCEVATQTKPRRKLARETSNEAG